MGVPPGPSWPLPPRSRRLAAPCGPGGVPGGPGLLQALRPVSAGRAGGSPLIPQPLLGPGRGGEPGTPSPSCTLSSGLPHAGLTPGLFAVQPHHDAEDMGQVQPLLGAPEWQAVVTGAGVSVLTTVTNDHRPGASKHQKRAPSQPRRPEVQSLGASRPALSREAPGEGPSCPSSPRWTQASLGLWLHLSDLCLCSHGGPVSQGAS